MWFFGIRRRKGVTDSDLLSRQREGRVPGAHYIEGYLGTSGHNGVGGVPAAGWNLTQGIPVEKSQAQPPTPERG